MKTKLLFWLAVLFAGSWLSTGALATEPTGTAGATDPEAVNVHRFDATIHSTMLDNVQRIRFSENEKEMYICTTDALEQTFILTDISKVIFGEYISTTPDVSTHLENLLPIDTNRAYKLFENNMLIIVIDGVKYNLWGMKL